MRTNEPNNETLEHAQKERDEWKGKAAAAEAAIKPFEVAIKQLEENAEALKAEVVRLTAELAKPKPNAKPKDDFDLTELSKDMAWGGVSKDGKLRKQVIGFKHDTSFGNSFGQRVMSGANRLLAGLLHENGTPTDAMPPFDPECQVVLTLEIKPKG